MLTHDRSPMRSDECHRLRGMGMLAVEHGCRCVLPPGEGFLDCPPEARRALAIDLPSAEVRQRKEYAAEKPRQSFTGDVCDNCGGTSMIRTGVCLTCTSCGTSNGGCS